jgi:hypothetical protein
MNFINSPIFIKSLSCNQYLRADTCSPGGPIADNLSNLAENIFDDLYVNYINLSLNRSKWEEFKMSHVGDNKFVFQCYNGKYIKVKDDGTIVLDFHINNDFDNNMIFEVIERENGYTIKSVENNGYLKFYGGTKGVRICNLDNNINISNLFNFESRDINRI